MSCHVYLCMCFFMDVLGFVDILVVVFIYTYGWYAMNYVFHTEFARLKGMGKVSLMLMVAIFIASVNS